MKIVLFDPRRHDRAGFACGDDRLDEYLRRFESQSLVALEAAACGCPVVGTAVGVLPELLDPQQVAPVGDAAALADAISELIRDPARRTLSASAGRAAVLARFTLDQTVAELETLYQELPSGVR